MIQSIMHWAEKLVVIMLSGSFILRMAPQLQFDPFLGLYLANELASAILVILQRRGQMAATAYPIAIAFAGTSLALTVSSAGEPIVPQVMRDMLIVAGLSIALYAKMSLRRSFGLVAANRGVRVGGPYRLVRHPMYSGYLASQVGFLLGHISAWNLGVLGLTWTLLWLRIGAEEAILRSDPTYEDYCERVRFRLLPGLI